MKLNFLIEKIESNQKEIHGHGKLDLDVLKKIDYKFRLDWNYYSNRMEGGTLTREETRSVMVGNIDVHGKPLKDINEMRGHDTAILDILKMAHGEQRISEKRIKEIHTLIMSEDDPEKKREIGQWKSIPNEIINYKGEKILFTLPLDVKDAVHALLDKTNAQLDAFFTGKKTNHPLEIAAEFHLDFVSIHPFYDGNGRMSRILSNLILVSCGFPPVIIKDRHKQVYYQLLADIQVYGGNVDLFHAFLAERLIDSQQLVLDAIAGKSIEEEDDLDKEILLWKQEIHQKDTEVVPRSKEQIIQTYNNSIRPLFVAYIERSKQFDDLFFEKYVYNSSGSKLHTVRGLDYFDDLIDFLMKSSSDRSDDKLSITELARRVDETTAFRNKYGNDSESTNEMRLEISFRGFKNNGADSFDEYIGIKVYLDQYCYRIMKDKHSNVEVFKKLYSEKLTPSEIDTFVKESVRQVFQNMKNRVKKQSGEKE